MRKIVVVVVLGALWTVLLTAEVTAQPPAPEAGRADHLSAGTASLLAALPPGEMATVVVTLAERADLGGIRGTRRSRLRTTVQRLRTTAASSQTGIRSRLRLRAAQGKVADVVPLWVSNAVSVTATADVIAELAARPDVRAVVPDAVDLVPAASTPTPNQTAIGAPRLWEAGHTGQGVVVASLDSGVDGSHPDLAGQWRGGTNSWFDPYGQHAAPTDLTGHGTGTMGVLVGGDTGGTSIGTAPGARWIAARVFNDAGSATATAVHQAFQWVLDPDHDPATADAPQVVNASWSLGSGPGCDLSFQPDVRALRAAGILPVFAAGNFGPGTSSSVSPANYPESLSVGAVSGTNLVYSASGRGPSTCGGRARVFPDLVAPGTGIRTTDRYGLYQTVSGTSLAAPHAAGALALLLGASPGLTPDQQQAALVGSAVDLGATGPDETYGAGLLDAWAAFGSLPPPPPPVPDFTVAVTPAAASVRAGDAVSFSVQVAPVDGFAGDVALSLTGLAPAEAGWTFTPAVVPGGSGTSTLTVTTTTGITATDHALTVSGTGTGLTRTAGAVLTATPPPPPPPPPDQLRYSTRGNVNPAGVGGSADDADVYRWDGTAHRRVWDASAAGLPAGADVDGYSRVDDTHFYLSFADKLVIPLPGPDLVVQDEDVVRYDGGTWRLWFDGSAHGIASSLAFGTTSVVGGTLYFTVSGGAVPPGAGTPRSGDAADVYRWNSGGAGNTYTRVFDASVAGIPAGTLTVDALDLSDPAHVFLSFSNADATVPGLGTKGVQDEDVVRYDAGTWSLYFDGTAHQLGGSADLDVDAIDVP